MSAGEFAKRIPDQARELRHDLICALNGHRIDASRAGSILELWDDLPAVARAYLEAEKTDSLTFAEVTAANVARAKRWHPGFPVDDSWNGADWSNAMCGEAGEAANVVKKLRRHETGHHGALDGDEAALREKLADELADVLLYADLLAAKYGIDLPEAIVRKFNEVSARQGFPERLRVAFLAEHEPVAQPTERTT